MFMRTRACVVRVRSVRVLARFVACSVFLDIKITISTCEWNDFTKYLTIQQVRADNLLVSAPAQLCTVINVACKEPCFTV